MTTQDRNDLTGVWYGPAGIRIEFVATKNGWRSNAYMTRRGRVPYAAYDFDTAEQVADAIRRLEATGHVRQSGRPPSPPLNVREDIARQWDAAGSKIDKLFSWLSFR